MRKIILSVLLAILFQNILAQSVRPFNKWAAALYVSYQVYHPDHYILADNNWEILMAFRHVHSRQYLDSIGIKNTRSQIMLLHIGGLLESVGNGRWKTTIPIFDSLQTMAIRQHSKLMAVETARMIGDDCKALSKLMAKRNMRGSTFTLLFSYILDNKCWKRLNAGYDKMMEGATWQGLYWLFYNKRPFFCGTNSYIDEVSLNQNWSTDDPSFINKLYRGTFYEDLLGEYTKHGKIVDSRILATAVKYRISDNKGNFQIPVINSKEDNEFNCLSDSICKKMSDYMSQAPYIDEFMKTYSIRDRKAAIIILFHEVIWDTLDSLVAQHIVEKPELWTSKHPNLKMVKDVFFICK